MISRPRIRVLAISRLVAVSTIAAPYFPGGGTSATVRGEPIWPSHMRNHSVPLQSNSAVASGRNLAVVAARPGSLSSRRGARRPEVTVTPLTGATDSPAPPPAPEPASWKADIDQTVRALDRGRQGAFETTVVGTSDPEKDTITLAGYIERRQTGVLQLTTSEDVVRKVSTGRREPFRGVRVFARDDAFRYTLEQRPNGEPPRISIDGPRSRFSKDWDWSWDAMGPLDGRMSGFEGQTLRDIFASAEEVESDAKTPIRTYSLTGPFGHLRVSLDLARDALPVSWDWYCDADGLYTGKPLRESKKWGANQKPVSYESRLTNVRIDNVSGLGWTVVSADLKVTLSLENGETGVAIRQFKRQPLPSPRPPALLGVSFTGRWPVDIPVATPVNFLDSEDDIVPSIPFAWDGTKPLPYVPTEEFQNIATAARTIGPLPLAQPWYVSVGPALAVATVSIALAGGVWVWRRRLRHTPLTQPPAY